MMRRLLLSLMPFALVAVLYRAMGAVRNLGLAAARVHVCDMRSWELALFGFNAGGQRITLQDWLQAHALPWLDLVCAVPYGTYLAVVIGYGVWLVFAERRAQSPGLAARFGWGFLALNLAGFITYHLVPTAPPWYFHAHGCAVDLATAASAGPNLTRVDAMLGVPIFAGLYSHSSAVFGAFPSLHVSYPLLMLLTGWQIHSVRGRIVLGAYWFWMCFSAVYLDHHWVIDVIAGSIYALTVFVALSLAWAAVRARAARRWVMS